MDNKSKIYLRKSFSPDGRAIIFEPSLVFKVDSLTYHQHNNHIHFIENDVADKFKKYLYLELHEKLHKAITKTSLPEMATTALSSGVFVTRTTRRLASFLRSP